MDLFISVSDLYEINDVRVKSLAEKCLYSNWVKRNNVWNSGPPFIIFILDHF